MPLFSGKVIDRPGAVDPPRKHYTQYLSRLEQLFIDRPGAVPTRKHYTQCLSRLE